MTEKQSPMTNRAGEIESCWSCEFSAHYPVGYNVDFYCLFHEMQAEENGWCSEWSEREESQ